jgi:methionyl-tRNA formyltransferase
LNILFLYGNDKALSLAKWLETEGNKVAVFSEKISFFTQDISNFDMIVSFTYRYFIPQVYVDAVQGNAVNLHISYLPWNKGADPNIWSWLEFTPKGVSIHYVTNKIDGGDIIVQSQIDMNDNETLRTSYDKLMKAVTMLFMEAFKKHMAWNEIRMAQSGMGSFHYSYELADIRDDINYDMPVGDFIKEYRYIAEQ